MSGFHYKSNLLDDPYETPEETCERAVRRINAYRPELESMGWSIEALAAAVKFPAEQVRACLERELPIDWDVILDRIENAIEREHHRRYVEAEMPVMTPVVKAILKTADDVKEDGAIGLVIGDSGTGKTQGIKAIRLTHANVAVVTVASSLVKPVPFLNEIRRQLRGVNYCGVREPEIFLTLRDHLPQACGLLVIDEAHLLKESRATLRCLIDLFNATGVPQLWIGTGDLERYLNRRDGIYDPTEQIRSRIQHRVDLRELVASASGLVTLEQVKKIASKTAPGVRFDAQSIVKLHALANLEREGALRLVETTIKTSVRIAKAANLPGVNGQIIDMATKSSAATRVRTRTTAPASRDDRLDMNATQQGPVVQETEAPARRSKVG